MRLAHKVFGAPTKAALLPVVILHGVLGHKTNWRSTATKLAKESGRQVCCHFAVFVNKGLLAGVLIV